MDSIWSNAWRRAIHQPASVRSAHATLRLNLARFPLNVGRDPCLGPALYHGHLPRNYGEKTGVEKKIRDRLIALGCIKCVVVDFVGKAVWQALVVFFSPPHLFAGESPWWMTVKKCKVFLRSNKRFRFCNIEALFWKHVAPQNLNCVSYL